VITPAMWAPKPFQTSVDAQWIDYNGHMRDAFYCLVISYAIDDLMDQVGIDAEYRAATGGTLYTLEMHLHFLHSVEGGEALTLVTRPLGVDRKRLHVGVDVFCPRYSDPAASAELMLLHVQQHPTPKSAPFPQPIAERLTAWQAMAPAAPPGHPASGRITLARH
jgi:acyl-CoA thioester hydrolase